MSGEGGAKSITEIANVSRKDEGTGLRLLIFLFSLETTSLLKIFIGSRNLWSTPPPSVIGAYEQINVKVLENPVPWKFKVERNK